MNTENKETMRQWVSLNGKAVRQRTVREETTMAKAVTLTEFCYHQELKPEDIEYNSDDPGNNENEKLEYDTDDGLEDCLENFEEEVDISKEITFLAGRTSRFGRAVKFNSQFF